MSAAFGLVKFKKTGNIYYCCYEGTSDTLNPYICTAKECYDEKLDCYCAISHCRELSRQHKSWIFPSDVPDLDEVEIYTDYGGGFYWDGFGSESARMLRDCGDPWERPDVKITDGMPKWAEEFLKHLED